MSYASATRLAQRSQVKARVAELQGALAERAVVDKAWGLRVLQGVAEMPLVSDPKASDRVAAVSTMGKWLGWEQGKRPLGEQPARELSQGGAVAADAHVLTRDEEHGEFADSIEQAAAFYGVESCADLVARLRGVAALGPVAVLTEGEEVEDGIDGA